MRVFRLYCKCKKKGGERERERKRAYPVSIFFTLVVRERGIVLAIGEGSVRSVDEGLWDFDGAIVSGISVVANAIVITCEKKKKS